MCGELGRHRSRIGAPSPGGVFQFGARGPTGWVIADLLFSHRGR